MASSLTLGLSGVLLLLAGAALCAPLGSASGAHSPHYNLIVKCQGVFVHSRFFAQGCLDDQTFLHYDGAHSLHYTLTVRSQGGSVQSRSVVEGYWDHQLFLQYDSDNQESAKPQGPWAENPLGTESWNTEMQELAQHSKKLKATLADINALEEQKGGSHSLQEIRGCKIQEDNRTRGFWNFYYDGEPFLFYHPETHSWKVQPSSTQTLAMKIKNFWDAEGMQSKDYWAHVQGELCGRLQRYLSFWKDSSHFPGASAQGTLLSPAVNVTCDEASGDTINVTCQALGFYPQDISVTWLQDGEPLSQDAQQSVGVLPYGNGTYQTWVSTRVPQGQEQRFSCHVGHSRNTSTGSVSCGTALPLSLWIIFPCVAAGAVAVIIIVGVHCYKKRRTTSAVEGSEPLSLQVPDQQQRTPSDHTGSTQLSASAESSWGFSGSLDCAALL